VGKELLIFLLGVAFSAGIFYQQARRTRKDLKGLRALLNRQADLTRQRFVHTVIVLMTMNEGKDAKAVLDLLRRDVG